MDPDKEWLNELALILESAEPVDYFIRIEANTAKDIASRLRRIANKLPVTVH